MITPLFFAPPRKLHEEFVVWKEHPIINRTASRKHSTFVNPVMDIPDVPKLILPSFRVVNIHGRQSYVPVSDH
jgi:hypothetical protein